MLHQHANSWQLVIHIAFSKNKEEASNERTEDLELVQTIKGLTVDETSSFVPTPAEVVAVSKLASVKGVEDDQTEEDIEEIKGEQRDHLNLVFIGHVDAGKSTLSGHILCLTNHVNKHTMDSYKSEAKQHGDQSMYLSWIMDTNEEERTKGKGASTKTVEVGRARFATNSKRYTILDAPGHRNYVPNMIMGVSQADVAVLVISARKQEFEAGFHRGGQTREHTILAKTLGVSYLVVVINKMDDPTVQWNKERFDYCVNSLRPFLKQCGFRIKQEVKFIPVSGLTGANIQDEVATSECLWWGNYVAAGENNTFASTLIGLLDSLQIEKRDPKATLRISVLDRYRDSGTIIMGKVESGTITVGKMITLMPTFSQYKVEKLWSDKDEIKAAGPGENVLVKLKDCMVADVHRGFVICSDESSLPCS